MPIIDFKAAMCKHCYKCVRGCEVKSIMIRDGHAYIMPNRCILCGQCLLICPQSAKKVPSELTRVKKFIESGTPNALRAHIFPIQPTPRISVGIPKTFPTIPPAMPIIRIIEFFPFSATASIASAAAIPGAQAADAGNISVSNTL